MHLYAQMANRVPYLEAAIPHAQYRACETPHQCIDDNNRYPRSVLPWYPTHLARLWRGMPRGTSLLSHSVAPQSRICGHNSALCLTLEVCELRSVVSHRAMYTSSNGIHTNGTQDYCHATLMDLLTCLATGGYLPCGLHTANDAAATVEILFMRATEISRPGVANFNPLIT